MNFIALSVGAEFRQHRFRLRALQRDQRAVGERLDDAGRRTDAARRCASSASLQAALTTRNRWIAEIRDHQIVEDAAGLVGELGVALPARCNRDDVLRHQPLQRQRGVLDLAGFRRAARSGPYARRRTGRRLARVCRCSFSTPAAILHRHVIAGERHHLAAARDMQRVQGRAFQRRFGHRAQASRGPRGSPGPSPEEPVEAPSVAVPESIIPSADAVRAISPRRLFPDAVKSRGPFA